MLALNQSLLPELFDFAEPSGRTSPVCPKLSMLLETIDDTKPLANAAPKPLKLPLSNTEVNPLLKKQTLLSLI